MRGIWSARECYCAVRVTVRCRWYDIVMLSSCALSEGDRGSASLQNLRVIESLSERLAAGGQSGASCRAASPSQHSKP